MTTIRLGGRRIGDGESCFVIAEVGVNHNGDVGMARELVDAAVHAGADAVKFQTFSAADLTTSHAPKAAYQHARTGGDGTQLGMLTKLELGEREHREIVDHCERKGIMFLSTPFDARSVELLAKLDVPAFKVASGDLTTLPLLAQIARHGRPMLLSTGMAHLGEIEEALAHVRQHGDVDVALLHCVSSYPAPDSETNLRAMETMRAAFGLPVGLSDHSDGIEIPLAAVALGAAVLEKHITLDRGLPGPDHAMSLEPADLRGMVSGIRKVERALGTGVKRATPSEIPTIATGRRSLVAARDIAAGETLDAGAVAMKRPGTGLPARDLHYVVGRRAKVPIPRDTLLRLEALE